MTTLDELGLLPGERLLSCTQKITKDHPPELRKELSEYHAADLYTFRSIDTDIARLAPELYLLGLNERLLRIAEHYVGAPISLIDVDLRLDVPEPADEQVGSRRWHYDSEDRYELKVAIYLTDVDENTCAFEYVPRSVYSKRIQGTLSSEALHELVDRSTWKQCYGRAGTTLLAATSHTLHHGYSPEFTNGRPRAALWYTYVSRWPASGMRARSNLSREVLKILEPMLTTRQSPYIIY